MYKVPCKVFQYWLYFDRFFFQNLPRVNLFATALAIHETVSGQIIIFFRLGNPAVWGLCDGGVRGARTRLALIPADAPQRSLFQGCQVQKIKKAKFGHKHFQKRPNPEKLKKAKFPCKN